MQCVKRGFWECATREGEKIIKIGDYILWKQPDVAEKLRLIIRRTLIVSLPFKAWEAIMQERPKPGLGGLLKGEKAV